MPRLSHLKVEHYRAFERGLELELRPLTLLYGKNNAGKSSIVRLLGVLDDSLNESAESPLDLRGAAGGGAAFVDILNARDRELRRLQLSLSWDDGFSARWSIGLHQVEGMELLQVEELLVTSAAPDSSAQRPMSWYGNPRVPEASRPKDAEATDSLQFRGLVPQPRPDLSPLMVSLRERLLEMRGRTQYLSAVRDSLQPTIKERGVQPLRLSARGGEAQDVLLSDRIAFAEVESWLRKEIHRELRKLSLGPNISQWLLVPEAARELLIPLAATGEGMAQLLPILVALALRRGPARPGGITSYALEEPTTHLHDDLQIRLAALFAKIAMEPEPPVALMETHARPLLLGIQLALLRGELDPSKVIVYWVEQDETGISSADPVEFNESGLPTTHRLRTAFEDEQRILRELSKAHLMGSAKEP